MGHLGGRDHTTNVDRWGQLLLRLRLRLTFLFSTFGRCYADYLECTYRDANQHQNKHWHCCRPHINMACSICMNSYDRDQYNPLVAPCGHTFCRACLMRPSFPGACPVCRGPLPAARSALPRNFALLEAIDGGASDTGSEEARMLRECGLLGGGEPSTSTSSSGDGEPVLLPVLRAADVQLTSQELGSGAFGRVMLGRFHGRDVAVKLLPLLGPADSRAALRREVAALASLSLRCSSMARLVGISVKDGRLALVMCRYQCSLAQSLAKQPGGRMASDEATLLARDLLRGLAQLHCHGVVMADLKPDNVLLDESGAPLLCDFGLSRAVRSTLGQHAPLSQVAGTANYM